MLPLAEACDFTAGSFKKEYGGRLNKWDEEERAQLMAELDAAYDQGKYAPNRAQILARYATNSEAVRARLGPPQRVAYGRAAALMLAVGVVTVPLYGALGAAIAYSCSRVAELQLLVHEVRRLPRALLPRRKLLAAAAMF